MAMYCTILVGILAEAYDLPATVDGVKSEKRKCLQVIQIPFLIDFW
jgi:hypothetical protein